MLSMELVLVTMMMMTADTVTFKFIPRNLAKSIWRETLCDIQPSIDLYGLSVWHIAVIPVYTFWELRVATIKSSNNGSETHSARFRWENSQQSFIIAIDILNCNAHTSIN